MRTAEEIFKEQRLNVSEFVKNKCIEAMKAYAKEACQEQRKICYNNYWNAENGEPKRYVVKRRFIFWQIETLEGKCIMLFLSHVNCVAFCDVLNAAYSLGYGLGQQTILKIFYPKKYE